MLSGRQLYSGETVTDTIAQVITQPPDWHAVPPDIPPAVRRILRRCLEKDPRNRFQSAGDVRIEIEEFLAMPGKEELATPHLSTTAGWKSFVPWAFAAMLLIALGIVLVRGRSPRAGGDLPPVRLEVRVGTGDLVRNFNQDGALVTLSRDGRMIAYAASTPAGRRLFVRPLDSLESRELAGTENAIAHTFSPDGRWIAFTSDAALRKVAVAGGAPTSIAEVLDPRGLTWGAADTIVYTPDTMTGLYRVSAGGGQPVQLTTPLDRERSHRWPSFLPDGKTVIFGCQMHEGTYDDGTIEAIRIDQETPARKVLVRGGTFPRYLASGHLTYLREGTLFVAPFDLQRLEVTGTAQPVLTGISSHGGTAGGAGNGAAQIAFSENGTAVYMSGGNAESLTKVVIMDRAGKVLHETKERGELRAPRFSPDGREVAFQARIGGAHNIHVWDPARAAVRKVTFEKSFSGFPIWAPDGKRIAFFSDRGGTIPKVFLIRSDGAGEPEIASEGKTLRIATSFSPDGGRLALMEQGSGGFDVVVVNLADKKQTPFLATSAQEMLAVFSPDGRWIAYQSDESGALEVYVRPYPGPGGKWQVSAGGGGTPVWTKGGRELLYLAGELPKARIMTVDVSTVAEVFHHSAPRVVADIVVSRLPETNYFDVTADGSRLAVLLDVDGAAAPGTSHAILIFNFFTEVRRAFSPQP
jgi:serine/threonine-protein kinase